MFKNLKAKIKEETGSEVPDRPLRNPSISSRLSRGRGSMSSQQSLDDLCVIEQVNLRFLETAGCFVVQLKFLLTERRRNKCVEDPAHPK